MTSSLTSKLPWEQLLPQLNIPLERPSLPAIVGCPQCGAKQLGLYHDALFGGAWHYCRACHTAGDMVQLAAKAWKCDLREALGRLRYKGLLPSAEITENQEQAYLLHTIGERDRVSRFWADSQARFFESETPELRRLQHRLGASLVDRDWWRSHGMEFVGGVERREADLLFSDTIDKPRPRDKAVYGRNWTDMLVFPFSDVPGRICGFMFAGRLLQPAQGDLAYRAAPGLPPQPIQESGLSMLSAAVAGGHPRLNNTLFVLDDAFLAARLQIQWLLESGNPLPITAYRREPTVAPQAVWNWLPRERVVCASTALKPDLLSEARRLNGAVSVETLELYAKSLDAPGRSPLGVLQAVRADARHWELALRDVLRKAPASSLEETLQAIGLDPSQLTAFLSNCEQSLRQRVLGVLESPHRTTRVRFGQREFYEREQRWYTTPGDELICDAAIRIEQVIQTRQGSFYQGKIHYRGRTVPFLAPTKDLDHNLFRWATIFLRDTVKLGVLVHNAKWGQHGVSIAVQFHQPEIVTGADCVGWDTTKRQIVFPGLTITGDGSCVPGTPIMPSGSPCQNFKLCWPISRKTIELVSEPRADIHLIWATILAVLREALAPAFHHERNPIILGGRGAILCGREAARLCGCEMAGVVADRLGTCLPENAHNWPLFVTSRFDEQSPRAVKPLDVESLIGYILPVAAPMGGLVALQRGATLVQYATRLVPQRMPEDAGQLVPEYLQSVFERRLRLPATSQFEESLVQDVANWFESLGGRGDVVREATAHLQWPPIDLCRVFLETLDNLFTRRQFVFVRPAYDVSKYELPALLYTLHGETPAIAIPQLSITERIEIKTGVALSVPALTQALKQAKILLGEESYNNERHWLVLESWWNARKKETT